MSYCAQQILTLATDTWNEIGSPTSISVGWISGVYSSSGYLASLGTKLDTCYFLSGDSPCIVGMTDTDAAIYQLQYKADYYQKASLTALAGGIGFVTLKEGDSSITREKSSDYSKAYLALAKDANQLLRLAVHDFKLNRSVPCSIDAAQLASFPTP